MSTSKKCCLCILTNRASLALLLAHAAMVLVFSPMMIVSNNREVGPILGIPLMFVDYPVFAWLPEWIQMPWPLFSHGDAQPWAAAWTYGVCPLIFGSILWFAVGIILALPQVIYQLVAESRRNR